MSSPSGGSSPDDPGPQWDRPEPSQAGDPDPRLLERVLEETLSSASAAQLDPRELQALTEVARRHPGVEAVTGPIIVEIVESILRVRFRSLDLSDVFWQAVSCQIATTLAEDPETHAKLNLFWNQLSELAT